MERPSDFDTELNGLNGEIDELGEDALALPLDGEKATRMIYRRYQRASLTGNLDEFKDVESAINTAIPHVRYPADLYYLKASVAFKFHRLADVKSDFAASRELYDSLPGRALRADLALQEGRYEEARIGYENLIEEDRTWDNLARLAYLKSKLGDAAAAEQLYIEAEDELTAKEMRHYAWVELQRGLLDLEHGRYDVARSHYERADRAYSGHWLIAEHMAELMGAEGRHEEAVALYKKVIGRVPRPEFHQALGELLMFIGKPDEAQPWFEKAQAAYLSSARRGDVHYYHHLADFYADVRLDGAEAVKWARKDLELRNNLWTQAALAWALYRDGRLTEALDIIVGVLAGGAADAHTLFKAAEIHRAAGKTGEGNRYLQKAAVINPNHHNFHVHR